MTDSSVIDGQHQHPVWLLPWFFTARSADAAPTMTEGSMASSDLQLDPPMANPKLSSLTQSQVLGHREREMCANTGRKELERMLHFHFTSLNTQNIMGERGHEVEPRC